MSTHLGGSFDYVLIHVSKIYKHMFNHESLHMNKSQPNIG
jgi:hypothetical protein